MRLINPVQSDCVPMHSPASTKSVLTSSFHFELASLAAVDCRKNSIREFGEFSYSPCEFCISEGS